MDVETLKKEIKMMKHELSEFNKTIYKHQSMPTNTTALGTIDGQPIVETGFNQSTFDSQYHMRSQ
jgi:hypothetical protein